MKKIILIFTLFFLVNFYSCAEDAKASSKQSSFKKSTSKEDYLSSLNKSNNKKMNTNFNSYVNENSKKVSVVSKKNNSKEK